MRVLTMLRRYSGVPALPMLLILAVMRCERIKTSDDSEEKECIEYCTREGRARQCEEWLGTGNMQLPAEDVGAVVHVVLNDDEWSDATAGNKRDFAPLWRAQQRYTDGVEICDARAFYGIFPQSVCLGSDNLASECIALNNAARACTTKATCADMVARRS